MPDAWAGKAAFDRVMAEIQSVNSTHLGQVATWMSDFGTRAITGGDTLVGSADTVGAQSGAPYAAYANRLRPVGSWLTRMAAPATDLSGKIGAVISAAEVARMELAKSIEALNGFATDLNHDSSFTGADRQAQMNKRYEEEAARLRPYVGAITTAYGQVNPQDPGTAPVNGTSGGDGAGGSAPMMAGAGAGGGGTAPAAVGGTSPAGGAGGAPAGGAAQALGPESGPFEGWVQDPTTGNLIDPVTGREVTSGGQFVDPVTGEAFGDASQYASRLAGIEGGGMATAVGGGGFVPTIGGVPAGGLEALRGGAAGGLVPGVGGMGGVAPGIGGAGGIAGYYGGIIPPSLAGQSAVGGQLRERAAENMAARARSAQVYASLAGSAAAGNTHAAGYLPPMGGAGAGGMGAGGGGRSARGRGLVNEPGSVWGASNRGAARQQDRRSGGRTDVVEDVDVWTAGEPPTAPALGGR